MNLNDLPYIMIRCLVLTILIETLLAVILKYRKKDLINIILVNIVTNPIVTIIPVYFNIHFGIKMRNIVFLILEILTLFIEGFMYSKFLKKNKINPYLLSLILNITSFGLGEIINYL